MRSLLLPLLAILVASVVPPRSAIGQSCEADEVTLCFEDSRFSVQLRWRDSDSNLLSLKRTDESGQAAAMPLNEDTGFLALDGDGSIDGLVRLIDGRAINGSFWVFAAAITAREFVLTVTDTMSGATVEYFNPLGERPSPITDTQAFPEEARKRRQVLEAEPNGLSLLGEVVLAERKGTTCSTDQGQICLLNDRFEIGVDWMDFQGGTGIGMGEARGSGTGSFWFFSPDNIELIVKIVDGAGINGNFWYGVASTTNVEFTLSVLDLQTGRERTYFNPLGAASKAVIDPGPLGVRLNRGHSGFWFNSETSGQGVSVELHPGLNRFGFLALYGFEPAAAGKLGADDQRWLTGQGSYAGDTFTMDLFSTSGGAFNDSRPATTEPVGTAQFRVQDCRNATLEIDLPDEEVSASIPLKRLLPQTGGLRDACAAIALGARFPSLD